MAVSGLNLHLGRHHVLRGVDLEIPAKRVTAIIGPSGCGKTSLLCCLNRMHDDIDDRRIEGRVTLGGTDIHAPGTDVAGVRRRVGMVFERARPFAKSVFDNVAYAPRLQGLRQPVELRRVVRWALNKTGLLKELGDRLEDCALTLSGGQQQRLLIARALAAKPRVLMFDEPAAGLDPAATDKLERLITELKSQYTIIVVTHNVKQAGRIADYVAFMDKGEIIEYGEGHEVIARPDRQRTAAFVEGRYG